MPWAVALALAAETVAAMQGRARVLIVAAPVATDPALAAQRDALAGWQREAADRDVRIVRVVGDRVTGAGDGAAALRRRYRLPADRFVVVLLGKDGHVALRGDVPIPASRLQGAIDAMPMRRAGQR